MGQYSFTVPYTGDTIRCKEGREPLIIITTNGEQELPPAFVRRCLVLNLTLPDNEEDFVSVLTQRAGGLFGDEVASSTLKELAKTLYQKRNQVSGNRYRPGLAEYLDHIAAMIAMRIHRPDLSEEKAIEELGQLVYEKDSSL